MSSARVNDLFVIILTLVTQLFMFMVYFYLFRQINFHY